MSTTKQASSYLTGGVVIGFVTYDQTRHEEVPGTLTAYQTSDGDIQFTSRVANGVNDNRINFVLTDDQRIELIRALGGVPQVGEVPV